MAVSICCLKEGMNDDALGKALLVGVIIDGVVQQKSTLAWTQWDLR